MEPIIVDCANSGDEFTRESGTDSIHQSAAFGAEIVAHGVTGCNGFRLGVFGQEVFTLDMLGVCLFNDEVGCEHGTS